MSDDLATWNSYIKCRVVCSEEERKRDEDYNHPFVTISRQTGAGGITVGQKLVHYLRANDVDAVCPWILADKNMINLVLREHGLSSNFQKYMPEKRVSEIKDMVEELSGLHPAQWVLVHKVSETVLHLGHMGYVVLVGRGANIITRKLKAGIHVRLIGSKNKELSTVKTTMRLITMRRKDWWKRMIKIEKGISNSILKKILMTQCYMTWLLILIVFPMIRQQR